MKRQIIIIVVLAIVQAFVIEARTIDDVLEDFQPIFSEIHDSVSVDQSYAHNEGNKRIKNMRNFLSQHSWDNVNAVHTSVDDITNKMTSILTETGMIHNENLIRHCFTKQQQDTAYYTKEAYATNEVCEILGSKDVKHIDSMLAKFYPKQANFHGKIETTRENCKNSKTPLEMQTCLIEHLYLIYMPAVKELNKEMKEVLKTIDNQIVAIESKLQACYFAVGERIIDKKSPVINDFKRCVIEAAKNKPVANFYRRFMK